MVMVTPKPLLNWQRGVTVYVVGPDERPCEENFAAHFAMLTTHCVC
jgi:hypothetical protein